MSGLRIGLVHVGGRQELVGDLPRQDPDFVRILHPEVSMADLYVANPLLGRPKEKEDGRSGRHATSSCLMGLPHPDPEAIKILDQGFYQMNRRVAAERMGLPVDHPDVDPSTRRPRPDNPAWCRAFYRPRNLSHEGAQMLRDLDPNRLGSAEPLGSGADYPHRSLESRINFLCRRYTCLDLLMRGHVFEELGKYFHVSEIENRERLRQSRYDRLGGKDCAMPTEAHLVQWLGVLRRATWEQLFAIEPYGKRTLVDQILNFQERGLVEMAPIQLGRGQMESIALTRKGMKLVKEQVPQADIWGWGPRKPLPSNREFHEQVVGDAVQYQIHIVSKETNKPPTSIWLDRGLRRLCQGMERVPDVRIGFELMPGVETYFDVEAEGIGRDYTVTKTDKKVSDAKTYRVFSATGPARGGNHVLIGR